LLLPVWLIALPNALPIITAGFPIEKREAVQATIYWLLPHYFINGANLLAYGVLQAKARYVANGLIPCVTPIATMVVLLATGASGSLALAISLVLGTSLEFVCLLITLYQVGYLRIPGATEFQGLRNIARSVLILLPGTTIIALGPVVDQAIAATMGEGTNAALSYGLKLPTALQGVLSTAIAITALSYFAREVGHRNFTYCLNSLDKLTRWLIVSASTITLPLILFSEHIVALLFQRGAFDSAATAIVSPIQVAYFFQLPVALVSVLGLKTLAALGCNALISAYATGAVMLQALLVYLLGMRYGAPGIAWAATIVSAVLALASVLTARYVLKRLST
jgi:putative peptidoglycan lipid II flippase